MMKTEIYLDNEEGTSSQVIQTIDLSFMPPKDMKFKLICPTRGHIEVIAYDCYFDLTGDEPILVFQTDGD